jgi:hypothetical protein
MPGKESRLDVREEPYRGVAVQDGVTQDILLSGLVCRDDGFPAFVVQEYRPAFALVKIGSTNLTTVDQGESQPVGEWSAEFLKQVKRQGGSTGSHGMQKTQLRIQTDRFQG